jgi:hypothetical protein
MRLLLRDGMDLNEECTQRGLKFFLGDRKWDVIIYDLAVYDYMRGSVTFMKQFLNGEGVLLIPQGDTTHTFEFAHMECCPLILPRTLHSVAHAEKSKADLEDGWSIYGYRVYSNRPLGALPLPLQKFIAIERMDKTEKLDGDVVRVSEEGYFLG